MICEFGYTERVCEGPEREQTPGREHLRCGLGPLRRVEPWIRPVNCGQKLSYTILEAMEIGGLMDMLFGGLYIHSLDRQSTD
jgi:hypothetical protein